MAKLATVIAEVNEFIDKTVRRLALDIVASLTAAPSEGGTPVDTGWASSNWIPYIGAAPSAPVGTRPDAGGVASRSVQAAHVVGLLSYTHDKGSIVIANNVPYIVLLNDGGKSRAPLGFVQAAISKAVPK